MARVLVVGSGGREHALVHALALEGVDVLCAPGSAGISLSATCFSVAATDAHALAELAVGESVDCVVIGPEAAVEAGVPDLIRARGVPVFGPETAAGRLETSKIFSKEFMREFRIPTARFEVVDSVVTTLTAAQRFSPPYVLKADGLAAGKGVYICPSIAELKEAAVALFDKQVLGESGRRALLEEHFRGFELSVLVVTNGEGYEVLPLAQDHKRLLDEDMGPNTGGMGTVAPITVPETLMARIHREVLSPSIQGLKTRGMLYRGVLFVGVMVTDAGPQVLEYNVRFGDPETQVVLPLLDGKWSEVFIQVARGECPLLQWRSEAAACVVVASPGYPDQPEKGVVIVGLEKAGPEGAYWLHAGTQFTSRQEWTASGGRVLNAVAVASDVKGALGKSYGLIEGVHFEGMQYRKDIGKGVGGR